MKKLCSFFLVLMVFSALLPNAAMATGEVGKAPSNQPNEAYYNENQSFGYDAFTKNGKITGVRAVTVGNTVLTKGSAGSTTGAAVANGVTISFEEGYYLSRYKIVCGDKYSCGTDAAGNAVGAGNVMEGAEEASITLGSDVMTKRAFGHTSRKEPYWLLIDVAFDASVYHVSYDWGELAGTLENTAPADDTGYRVNSIVRVAAPSEAATSEAYGEGYVFAGWRISIEPNNIYQAGNQFGMPQDNVTLTAVWEQTERRSLTVTKQWDDGGDQDGLRPESISVSLYRDGELYDTRTVTESYTWQNLARYSLSGSEIKYSVAENDPPEGYTTEIIDDGQGGYIVRNSHTPEIIDIEVTKRWEDDNDRDGLRPNGVTVYLLADGESAGRTLTLSEGNDWAGTFTGLARFSGGNEISYTVTEQSVDGYSGSMSGSQQGGFVTTNSHTPETVTVTVTKIWDDNNDQDGKRPQSINISLNADGQRVRQRAVTVGTDGNWSCSFEDLPRYAEGRQISYTVTEETVDEYTASYSHSGYDWTVTDTHDAEKTSITVRKVWQDDNDRDGCRPNSVTVRLLANGSETGETLVLNAGNEWQGSFSDLNRFKRGNEIEYTVRELEIAGDLYTASYSGSAGEGYTVTDTHAPELTSFTVSKLWQDNDNQDGTRPESVEVTLYANGREVKTQELTAGEDSTWTFTFNNLYRYENGEEINYTVTEREIGGYYVSSIVNGVITNVHDTEKTSVTVTKRWEDSNDQDGIRPERLTLHLLADGRDTGKRLVLDSNNWQGVFADLDKYGGGREIAYSVTEDAVDGYSSVTSGTTSSGFIITNSHRTETIDISGRKLWNDGNNRDGKRPESVTVRLLANGREVESQTVKASADGTWRYSFTNIPRNAGGTPIAYSVLEDTPAGYQTSYDGYDITNIYSPDKVSVTVLKSWQDDNDSSGIRPESVVVRLQANGKDTGLSARLAARNGWKATFIDLPRNNEGKPINYTVTEDSVRSYNTVVNGSMDKGFVITNAHTAAPRTGDISNVTSWKLLVAAAVTGLVISLGVAVRKRRRP